MDISYLLFLQRLRAALPPFWEKFFNTVSVWDLSIYAVLFIPCLLYWCLDKSLGQRVMFSYIGARFINAVLKLTVCCYRPWIRDSRVVPAPAALGGAGGYSFPSGHSSSGMGLFGSAGWVLRRRFCGLLTAALWVFIALVLFSRNFLGVHTPQDVIVGAAVGVLAIWLAGLFLDWEGRLDEGAAKGVGGIGTNALDKGGLSDEFKTTRLLMRLVPAKNVTWWMGAPSGEAGQTSANAEFRHKVKLTSNYYLGVFPVTQKQYSVAYTNAAPFNYKNNATYPSRMLFPAEGCVF